MLIEGKEPEPPKATKLIILIRILGWLLVCLSLVVLFVSHWSVAIMAYLLGAYLTQADPIDD